VADAAEKAQQHTSAVSDRLPETTYTFNRFEIKIMFSGEGQLITIF
jgi:hypothetical protein